METALFSAEIHELHKILHWIRVRLEKSGVQGKEVRRIELAAEEAVVNVILHGYEGKKGRVEVGIKKGPGRIELLFRDWGPPFDPLSNAPKVDPSAPLEEREAGGLGIFFMQQIMDEIAYRRESDANILTLVKHFSQTK